MRCTGVSPSIGIDVAYASASAVSRAASAVWPAVNPPSAGVATGAAALAVAWVPQTGVVASGWSDGVVRLFDPEADAIVGVLTGSSGSIRSIALTEDGTRLAFGESFDGVLKKELLEVACGFYEVHANRRVGDDSAVK